MVKYLVPEALGPTFYDADRAALFFGREKEIRNLYHLIRRQRLVLLNGYSGTGKSSLLHAGLLPRMEEAPGWAVLRPLRRTKQAGGLHRQLQQLKENEAFPEDKRTLIILDQVEEMYTDPLEGASGEAEIPEFGALLRRLLDQTERVHLILAFRSEFEPRITNEFLPKYRLFQSTGELYLHPLKEEGMVNAIKGPGQYEVKFKLEVSDPVARSIAKDFVGDRPGPYAVLLQIQLVELWKAAKQSPNGRKRVFTQELYEQHRREDLEKFIDDQLEELKKNPEWESLLNKGLGLDILYGFTTSMGTATSYEDALFYEKYRHIKGLALKPLLDAFKRHYLLQTASQDGPITKLTHDTLAPIIRKKYTESDAPGQRARRIVETKRREIGWSELPSFSEADIDTITAGLDGMEKLPEKVFRQIQHDQARYRQQKRDRFWLALNTAEANINHLAYEPALENLRIAARERLHPEKVLALALDLPFYLLESGQFQLFKDCLRFIQEQQADDHDPLYELLNCADGAPESKKRAKDLLKKWKPEHFRTMQTRHFPEMLPIKGGTYPMGSEEGFGDEQPVHQVSVSDFQMAATPVTFWQYGLYCQINDQDPPGDSGFGRGDRPVIYVSWIDAIKYCNWLSAWQGLTPVYQIGGKDEENVTADWDNNGYRLPTEAEWEYAAREGGTAIRFGNGKQVANVEEMNFNAGHPYNKRKPEFYVEGKGRGATTPVKAFAPNALGLYDMSGNVLEWCWDKWSEGDYYQQSEGAENPTGPEDSSEPRRVVRGGSWNYNAIDCRCSFRLRFHPFNQYNFIGFRVARRLF